MLVEHLEGLEESVDGFVRKNLGNDGVAGHSCDKLSLRQLVVLVPEINMSSALSPFFSANCFGFIVF